ncbi:MFS transporter [Intestinibacillus massiliensis]|uniref:MFS transporter n=1 Tax=Intestinibacillus massiliensis TaxID=1871029 RepID=UPI001356289B|nr:MFS transporter [Intestinibacillus massiliensis]
MQYPVQQRLCKLSTFLFALCTNMLSPLILSIGGDFHASLQDTGALFLVFYAGNFVACIFCGKLLSVFGKPRALRASMFAMAALTGLMAAAPHFLAICAILFLLGFIVLVIQVASVSICSALSVDGAASSVAGVQAFSALGACGGLLWSGAVLTLGLSWRMSYLFFAVLTFAASILFVRVVFPALPQEPAGGARELLAILRQRRFHPTFLCLALYAGAETAICSWLVTYLTRDLGFSSLAGSAVPGLIWTGLFIGRLACARLARTVPVRRILMVLIPVGAACVLALPHLRGAGIWIAAAVLGLFLSGCWPFLASGLVDDPAYDSGTTLSLAYLFSFFANAVAPYIIGAVADHTSLPVAITVDGLIFSLLFVVFLLFWGRKKAAG